MAEWTREYKNLKQRISTMDRDVFKLLTFTKTTTLKNEIQGLIEFEERKEFERHCEMEELYVFISALKKDLANLKDNLKNYSKNPASLSKIQEITEKLEDKMSKFKEKQMLNFDRLLEEEEALFNEIELINMKLDTYEAPVEITELVIPKSKPVRPSSMSKRTGGIVARKAPVQIADEEDEREDEKENESNLANVRVGRSEKPGAAAGQDLAKQFKEQIDRINSEIEKLGNVKNLGWETEDHQMFLKIRTKHKNNIEKIAFVNDCITSLPFYSEEDIQEHIQKFKKYMDLEEEKKKLTKEYKENKENEKKNMLELIRQEDMRKEEQMKNRMASLGKQKEDKEKMKEKLKEWRATKVARLAVEEEKVKEVDIMKKKEREMAEKARKEAAAKKVQEFKEKRELEKIREKEKEEYKKSLQKRRLDQAELERLKEKEDELLKKTLEKIALKKKKEDEKIMKMKKIMESNSNNYAYVEPKLTEETKAAVGRKREKFDPTKDTSRIGDTFGGVLARPFGRAVPSWRNGL